MQIHHRHRAALLCFLSGLAALPVLADPPATFQTCGIPPGGSTTGCGDVSADGLTVVGSWANPGTRAFAWSQTSGIADLGGVTLDTAGAAADVNADGSIITGTAYTGNGFQGFRIFRLERGDTMENLGVWAGGPANSYSQGSAISRDGQTIVGQSGTNSLKRAVRWTRATGMLALPTLPGGRTAWAQNVNADGSVVVGASERITGLEGETHAFRWTSAGGTQDLGILPGLTPYRTSVAYAVTGDGSVVAGISIDDSVTTAFKWTQATGMVALPQGPNTSIHYAYAISDDAKVIAGRCSTPQGYIAIRWTDETGLQNLNTYFRTLGIDLTGWKLTQVAGITPDGLTMAGSGSFNGVRQSWIARMSSIHRVCPADFNNDLTVDDADFVQFASQYDRLVCGTSTMPTCPADINADGYVDDSDFVNFATAYDTLLCP